MIRCLFILLCLATVTCAETTSRVVRVHDPGARDGLTGQPARLRAMVATGLQALTGQTTETAAWQQLVAPTDIVGIKVATQAGPAHVPHPALVAALTAGLELAGVATNHIIVFDRDPQKLRAAGYASPGGRAIIGETGWDEAAFLESKLVGKLIWGDLHFGKADPLSTRSHLPKLLTHTLTKLINVPVLLDHESAGLAGALYNVTLGLADNVRRFEQPGQRPDPAIVELAARPELRQKLMLNITDALVAGYAGGPSFKPQYSWAPASLYFSRDAVALDAVCLEVVEAKRREQNIPPIGERAGHIAAAAHAGLGQAAPAQIELREISHE